MNLNKRLNITIKYKRKIRLLVTNNCNNSCEFCHNEGMDKQAIMSLDIDKFQHMLPQLAKLSNNITVSGGEPFLYSRLEELIFLLNEFGYNITINTGYSKLEKYYKILHFINHIHISLFDFSKANMFIKDIKELRRNLPNLIITINIPVVNIETINKNIGKIYNMCKNNNFRLQFLRIIRFDKSETSSWDRRWADVYRTISTFDLTIIDSTNREVTYESKDGVRIDIAEIPCVLSGDEYGDGKCLHENDYTISPDLKVAFCRWEKSNWIQYNQGDDVIELFRCAYEKCFLNCRYCNFENYIKKSNIGIFSFMNHNTWPSETEGCIMDISRQISVGEISYIGKEGYVSYLENKFSQAMDIPYALTVSSGTVALYLAFLSLGLTEGAKVVVPTYSYPGVVTALIHARAEIILCDVEGDTGNISVRSFINCLDDNIKGVVVTHLWGAPANINEIVKICKARNIKVVEDCSHAYGAKVGNKNVGTIGDVGCFSLQSNKAVYAGEGGLLITKHKEVYEKAVLFSMLKKRIIDCVSDKELKSFWYSGLGLKVKLHPLSAIIALNSLKNLKNTNQRRSEHIRIIDKKIKNSNVISSPIKNKNLNEERVYYTFKFLLHEKYIYVRDKLVNDLILEGLDVTASSFLPIHKTRLYNRNEIIKSNNKDYTGAELYFSRIISLPSFTYEPYEISEFYSKIILDKITKLQKAVRIHE